MKSPTLASGSFPRMLSLAALVSTLILCESVGADAVIENKDVSIAEKYQIKLEDKLKEAADEKKPVVVLFGQGDNPDLQHLYHELKDGAETEVNTSLLLVIDPELEGENSPFRDHIREEINKKRGLNTAVFSVKTDATGKIQLSKAAFNRWGHQNGIANDITKSVDIIRGSLGSSTSTPGVSQNQGNSSTTPPGANTGQSPGKIPASTTGTLKTAREHLLKAAAANSLDTKRLITRMNELEQRAPGNTVQEQQIADCYSALSEVLTSQKKSPSFDRKALDYLVELTLHNVARPTAISQGNHPTCNVTTLEVYMAARHPDVYADMVRQVALTGTYATAKGEKITPAGAAILPGLDENSFDIDLPPANKRNHASQLVQMTLVNGVYQTGRHHEKTDSKGKKLDQTGWHYIVGPPVKTYFRVGNQWAYTTDEDQLLDKSGKPVVGNDGKAIRNPDMTGDDILEASMMVLDYKMPYLDAPYMITGQPWVYDLPTAQRLLKYKTDGKIPLGVHTMGGMHVQTIHDVVIKNNVCWVLIDNQRGEKDDGWIKLETLHKTQKSMNYQFTPVKSIP